jgi:hypothetical protein
MLKGSFRSNRSILCLVSNLFSHHPSRLASKRQQITAPTNVLKLNWINTDLYYYSAYSAWLWSERSPVRVPRAADFLRLEKGVWVLDDGAGRRKGTLAIYTSLGRACTAECCVCNIRAQLRNSTWASVVQTGYLEPQRALRTMSNWQVPPLVNNK